MAIAVVDDPQAPGADPFPDPRDAAQADKRTAAQRRRAFRKDRTRRRRLLDRISADPTVTACARSVYGHFLRYSDDSAKPVWIKNATVAERLMICERTVQRCTAELEALGYLTKVLRPVAASRNASNLYYFATPPGPIPEHHPHQRRRYRIRSSHRATLESGGTFSPTNPPAPLGAPAGRGSHHRRRAAFDRRPIAPNAPRAWSDEREIPAAWLAIDDPELVADLVAETQRR